MPINGINRPGASIPSTPSAPAAPSAPAVSTPATPAAPSTGWVGRTGGPTTPGRVDAAVTRLKGKAVELAMDQVADEHTLGTGFNLGAVSGNLKVSEELGLKGTDSYKKLVDGDRRRSDYAKANPDAVWVATKGIAGASASFPAGAGVSLGFNGGVEVSSLMAHDVRGASDVKAAVASQAKSMVLPLDAEGLQGLKAAPGSEWMFRGTTGSSVGAGLGASTSVGTGVLGASASVGLNASASASATYTKNVKVLGDDKVFVQVARVTTEGTGASLGVTAGININAGDVVGGQAGRQLDRLGNRVENATRINASVSANASATQEVMGAAVLDLSTAAGREAYDYILRSGPGDAADFIESQHLGVKYTQGGTAASSGIGLQFGSANLLSTSTVRGTTKGTVEDPGGTTQLTEATFGRSVTGFLPRLALGEERQVSVRAGSVTKNGNTDDAVALSLSVKDAKLTADELSQLDRFAKGMGSPLDGLPKAEAGKSYGKADYAVSVALTDAQVEKMSQWGDKDLRLAFAAAEKDIDGSATLPPWQTDPQTFAWYKEQLDSPANMGDGGNDAKTRASLDYKEKYGRDLQKDVDSANAIDAIVGQVVAKKGEPVSEWGGVLEALGKAPSTDVRAAALALRRLAGAEVVGLSVSMNGQTYAVKPEAAAPKTLADVVGPMLAPPA